MVGKGSSEEGRRDEDDDVAINDINKILLLLLTISLSILSTENGKKDFSVAENNRSSQCLSRKAEIECIPSYRKLHCYPFFCDMHL